MGNPKQTLTATDGAPPAIVAASTADADDDGVVDRIDLTFSEPIDDGASTLDASAFSLSAGSVDGVTTGATADDDALRLSVSGLSGSDATPDVTVASGTPVDPSGTPFPNRGRSRGRPAVRRPPSSRRRRSTGTGTGASTPPTSPSPVPSTTRRSRRATGRSAERPSRGRHPVRGGRRHRPTADHDRRERGVGDRPGERDVHTGIGGWSRREPDLGRRRR
ncbi:hypothetical protein ACFQJD_14285 [Haloplanus sp. GCM10025708]